MKLLVAHNLASSYGRESQLEGCKLNKVASVCFSLKSESSEAHLNMND